METSLIRSRVAMAAAAVLLVANVVVPVVWGDVYPFTSAPMFRDSPQCCCNYCVYAVDGRELLPADWLLQRVYDGNPVGYGVGTCPPAVIEQEFGDVHSEEFVRAHCARQLEALHNDSHRTVEIVQEVIGPIDAQRVGIVKRTRWQIAAAE